MSTADEMPHNKVLKILKPKITLKLKQFNFKPQKGINTNLR